MNIKINYWNLLNQQKSYKLQIIPILIIIIITITKMIKINKILKESIQMSKGKNIYLFQYQIYPLIKLMPNKLKELIYKKLLMSGHLSQLLIHLIKYSKKVLI